MKVFSMSLAICGALVVPSVPVEGKCTTDTGGGCNFAADDDVTQTQVASSVGSNINQVTDSKLSSGFFTDVPVSSFSGSKASHAVASTSRDATHVASHRLTDVGDTPRSTGSVGTTTSITSDAYSVTDADNFNVKDGSVAANSNSDRKAKQQDVDDTSVNGFKAISSSDSEQSSAKECNTNSQLLPPKVTPVPSSSSKLTSFSKVTSLQARVQSDMPRWNADYQRFVSSYYHTFDEKYRAVADTVNMASVEGSLKYVQAECINASVVNECKRKNDVKYVVFYQTTVVQPIAAMEYYANVNNEHDLALEHCPFMPMDGGQCNPNKDGSFPDKCNQYIGAAGQPDLGFCVGGSLQDNEAVAPYPHNYWFSFPNSCPQQHWNNKTEFCRKEQAGGLCALGVEPDGVTCTFSYDILGYILLDDVVGITSMINPSTGITYANYFDFCKAGGIEFSVLVFGDKVTWLEGIDFWANPGDSQANAKRAEYVVAAYTKLIAKNPVTSDGGVMLPLATANELTAMNPPCYENSKTCANAQFGCRRSYRSQICEVCMSADSGCM